MFVLLNRLVFGCYIGAGVRMGRGVSLGYGALGIVIHDRAIIGDDVRIGPGVTIGGRSKLNDVPVLHDRCVISTGAKILGPIQIGEESVVGANAVVVKDVDPRTVVAGVPAVCINREIAIADYHDGISSGAPSHPSAAA